MVTKVTRYLLAGMTSMLLCGCSQADQSSTMTKKEIDTLISKEVPVGSSTSQVTAFLDASKIEHSDYREKERTIYGIVRNTSGNSVVKGSFQIEFHFDEGARLKDYTVKEVFTGP